MDFTHCSLGAGVRLHLCETDKFNTVTCKLFVQQNLASETAAATALIPAILKRGSQKFPSTRQIARELEYLHAASFSADVLKIGERQLLEFYFDMIDPTLLPDGDENWKRGLATFWDIAFHPVTQDGAFVSEYFDQEKLNLRREVEGLINDKRGYALARAVELMCSEEPYGVYRYGSVPAIEALENGAEYRYYQELLATRPMDIFLVGRNLDLVANEIARLEFPRNGTAQLEPPVLREAAEERWHIEELPAQQSVLVLGYRTNLRYMDPGYYGLVVMNGALGGFPHSKLFVNVREKNSLAYFASSSFNSWRGMVLTAAGVHDDVRHRVRDLVTAQVEAMKRGEISDEELDNTKAGLLRRLRSESDSQSALVRRRLTREIMGGMASPEELVERILRVTKDDVVSVAENAELKAVYMLRAKDDGVNG